MKNACFSYFAIQLAFLNFPYNIFERKKKFRGLGWSLLLFLNCFWLFAFRNMLGWYSLAFFFGGTICFISSQWVVDSSNWRMPLVGEHWISFVRPLSTPFPLGMSTGNIWDDGLSIYQGPWVLSTIKLHSASEKLNFATKTQSRLSWEIKRQSITEIRAMDSLSIVLNLWWVMKI